MLQSRPSAGVTTELFGPSWGRMADGDNNEKALDAAAFDKSDGKKALASTSGLTQEAVNALDDALLRAGHRRRSLSDTSQHSVAKAIGTLGTESSGMTATLELRTAAALSPKNDIRSHCASCADAAMASVTIGEQNRHADSKSSAIKAMERQGLNQASTPRPVNVADARVVDESGQDRPRLGSQAPTSSCCVLS